ncbi:MAG: hypothetical protein V5A87_07290, partial [Candidatus Bipolaricaulota bacterium]
PKKKGWRARPRSERAISPLGKLIPGFIERLAKAIPLNYVLIFLPGANCAYSVKIYELGE